MSCKYNINIYVLVKYSYVDRQTLVKNYVNFDHYLITIWSLFYISTEYVHILCFSNQNSKKQWNNHDTGCVLKIWALFTYNVHIFTDVEIFVEYNMSTDYVNR